MGPRVARATSVSPAQGPDFEMPFTCGQSWTGTTRSTHSPSSWTIDWNAPNDLGKPALASAPGLVTRAVSLTGSYGRYVVVDHGKGYTTLYAHLNQIVARVGQVVDQGDLLGYVGGSGNVTGPHLHHEERLGGRYFHPYLHRAPFSFGATRSSANCNDRPLAGDWDGNGRAEIGVLRTTPRGTVAYLRQGRATRTYAFGAAGDTPVVGDFDGNGTTQLGVHKQGRSTWWLRTAGGRAIAVDHLGAASDVAVTGDWDGNRRSDLGWYRSATHTFYERALSGSSPRCAGGRPATSRSPVTGTATGAPTWGCSTRPRGRGGCGCPPRGGFTTRTVVWGIAGDNIPADRRLERRPDHRPRGLASLDRAVLPAHHRPGRTDQHRVLGLRRAPRVSGDGSPSGRDPDRGRGLRRRGRGRPGAGSRCPAWSGRSRAHRRPGASRRPRFPAGTPAS